jgi:CheY-like chemotaxis protein
VATNKILVIDDSRVIRKTVRDMLPEGDFEIVEAKDGVEGMDKLTSEQPSLIMLDFILPKMSGWEVFQQIQSNPDFQKIPLVLMSGKKEEVTDKMSEPFEFFEFIEKPFDRSILADAIRQATVKSRKVRPQAIIERSESAEAVVDGAALAELHAQIAEVRDSIAQEMQTLQGRFDRLQEAQASEVTAISPVSSEEVQAIRSQLQELQAGQIGQGAGVAGSSEEVEALRFQIQALQQARQADKDLFAAQIDEFIQAQAAERQGFTGKITTLEDEVDTLKKQLGQLVVLIKKKLM